MSDLIPEDDDHVFVGFVNAHGDVWVRLDCIAGFVDIPDGCDLLLDAGTAVPISGRASDALAHTRDAFIAYREAKS